MPLYDFLLRFFLIQLLRKSFVLTGKFCFSLQRILPRLLQQTFLRPQRKNRFQLREQILRLGRFRRGCRTRRARQGRGRPILSTMPFGSFVLVELILHQREFVAAGTCQVLIRIIHFIFVETRLRVREIKFVLDCVLRTRTRFRQRRGQIRDAILIRPPPCVRLLHAFGKWTRLRCQRRRVFLRIVKRRCEREINGTIRDPQSFLSVVLFPARHRQRSQLLRRLQRAGVHNLLRGSRRTQLIRMQPARRVRPIVRVQNRAECRHHQQHQHAKNPSLDALHASPRRLCRNSSNSRGTWETGKLER